MRTPSPVVNIMIQAIMKASPHLVRDFGEIELLQISKKGLGDFVSSADRRSERLIIQELQRLRPDYCILSEEAGVVRGRDLESCFIVDPLDGTANFLHGIAHFSISIALKKRDVIIAGVTYDIIKDEFFWSERGMGAYVNQRRIRVSSRQNLQDALIGVGTPYEKSGTPKNLTQHVFDVIPHSSGIRRMGATSLDLAYVAAGRMDAFFEAECKPWDIAAGILFVQEAGGTVTEIGGGSAMLNSGSILAGNESFHKQITDLIAK